MDQSWRKALLFILYTVVVAGLWFWWRTSNSLDSNAMVQALPEERMVSAFVDLNLLRGAGFLDVLTGSKTPMEPEYIRFVKDTGFDYRTDLDSVAAGFANGRTYFVARGHFDWLKLSAYAKGQGGECAGVECHMQGSQPQRVISFTMLQPSLLALAVTPEANGVNAIRLGAWKNPPSVPRVPVWVSAPGPVLEDSKGLPDGSKAFFSPLAKTDRAAFTLSPANNGFSLDLNATCTQEVCKETAEQLTKTTDLLRKMLNRDNLKPASGDLTSILTSGVFQASGGAVTGRWPIEKAFLEKLAADRLP